MGKNTSVRLNENTYNLVRSIGYLENRTMGNVIDTAVKEFLSQYPDLRARIRSLQDLGALDDQTGE